MLRRSELIFSRVYSSELSRSFAGENKVVKMLKSTQNKMYMKHFSQDNVHCIGHICFVKHNSIQNSKCVLVQVKGSAVNMNFILNLTKFSIVRIK